MSTTASQIMELVKSLPLSEQRAVCDGLNRQLAGVAKPARRRLQRLADGSYYNPDGIPNDHPIFKILEEEEAARRKDFGPPPPDFD